MLFNSEILEIMNFLMINDDYANSMKEIFEIHNIIFSDITFLD